MALSKQHWVSFQTWCLSKNTPKTQVATGMRSPDSESLWKGREHHKAVLSCFFTPPCSDLNISQICPQGRSWQGRCLTSCAGCWVGSPRLSQGSQACSLLLQLCIKTYIKAIQLSSHWGWMGLRWKLYFDILTPARPVSSPDLLWTQTLPRQMWADPAGVMGKVTHGRSAPFIHSLVLCSWVQEVDLIHWQRSVGLRNWPVQINKGVCSTVLRSPVHIYSPETVLSASLDVSALISCGSDGNPTHAEPGITPRRGFVHSK